MKDCFQLAATEATAKRFAAVAFQAKVQIAKIHAKTVQGMLLK